MDIIKIQEEIFGKEKSKHFFTSLKEVKSSIHSEKQNRNLLLDLLDSPAILPLFNPISYNDMVELIKGSDLNVSDSNGDNALLIAVDKNIGADYIEKIIVKSNLAHKNNHGVNVLTLAVINQHLISTPLLQDIENSKSESFTVTRKSLSTDFYTNREIDATTLSNKYQALKRLLKKYDTEMKEKNKTHQDIFSKVSQQP